MAFCYLWRASNPKISAFGLADGSGWVDSALALKNHRGKMTRLRDPFAGPFGCNFPERRFALANY